MIETRGNANEPPALRALSRDSRLAVVFIEVDDLEAVIAAQKDAKVAVERHKTFYHADELTYEEPGGHLVTFAKFQAPAPVSSAARSSAASISIPPAIRSSVS
jgi:hypothetical protein